MWCPLSELLSSHNGIPESQRKSPICSLPRYTHSQMAVNARWGRKALLPFVCEETAHYSQFDPFPFTNSVKMQGHHLRGRPGDYNNINGIFENTQGFIRRELFFFYISTNKNSLLWFVCSQRFNGPAEKEQGEMREVLLPQPPQMRVFACLFVFPIQLVWIFVFTKQAQTTVLPSHDWSNCDSEPSKFVKLSLNYKLFALWSSQDTFALWQT